MLLAFGAEVQAEDSGVHFGVRDSAGQMKCQLSAAAHHGCAKSGGCCVGPYCRHVGCRPRSKMTMIERAKRDAADGLFAGSALGNFLPTMSSLKNTRVEKLDQMDMDEPNVREATDTLVRKENQKRTADNQRQLKLIKIIGGTSQVRARVKARSYSC